MLYNVLIRDEDGGHDFVKVAAKNENEAKKKAKKERPDAIIAVAAFLMDNPEHVVRCYRNYILGCKRKYGTARSQVHYLHFVKAYLLAKREMFKSRPLSSVGSEHVTIKQD